MNKRNFCIRLALLLGLVVSVGFFSLVHRVYLLSVLAEFETYIGRAVAERFYVCAFWYVVVYTLDSIFALPLASILAFFAGRYFGFLTGFILTMMSMLLGAMLAFLAIRYFVGSYFQTLYKDKFIRFNKLWNMYGSAFLFFVRMVPMIPFSFVNIAAAFTPIHFWNFVLTTFFGMAPLLFSLTLLGASSTTFSLDFSSIMILLSLFGILSFLLFFLLKNIGLCYSKNNVCSDKIQG